MASGYGNRSKWTVNELLTRNEQARALGQKGLSDSQIGAGLEGAIGADLQAAGVHEQNLIQNKFNNQRIDLAKDAAKNAEQANTMGGIIKTGSMIYDQYKKGNITNPLTEDNAFARNIVRPIQNQKALDAATNVPTEDMYGQNTLDATGAPIGTPQNFAQEMSGALGDFGTQQISGQGTDFVSTLAQGGTAEQAIGTGIEAATDVANATTTATTAANAAPGLLSGITPFVGPAGFALNLGSSIAQGNYGKAAFDATMYSVGAMFGPVGMFASLAASFLPPDVMNPIYDFFKF